MYVQHETKKVKSMSRTPNAKPKVRAQRQNRCQETCLKEFLRLAERNFGFERIMKEKQGIDLKSKRNMGLSDARKAHVS